MLSAAVKHCPRGSLSPKQTPIPVLQCCIRYIESFDTAPAPDALALMRSRYTAYTLENESYLLDTWALENRPQSLEFDRKLKWLGLDIKQYSVTDEDSATVTFVARYRQDGRGARLQETSRFVRRAGRWYYLDGQ